MHASNRVAVPEPVQYSGAWLHAHAPPPQHLQQRPDQSRIPHLRHLRIFEALAIRPDVGRSADPVLGIDAGFRVQALAPFGVERETLGERLAKPVGDVVRRQGRQHAATGPGGSASRLALIEHADLRAVAAQRLRAGQADDAAADDDDAGIWAGAGHGEQG